MSDKSTATPLQIAISLEDRAKSLRIGSPDLRQRRRGILRQLYDLEDAIFSPAAHEIDAWQIDALGIDVMHLEEAVAQAHLLAPEGSAEDDPDWADDWMEYLERTHHGQLAVYEYGGNYGAYLRDLARSTGQSAKDK